MKGLTADHYTFDIGVLKISFITAIGSTVNFQYHKEKTSSVLNLFPSDGEASCVCGEKEIPFGQAKGFIKYGKT